MKISPIMSQNCQSRLRILQLWNKLSKIYQRLVNFCQKWQIFAKSGHTERLLHDDDDDVANENKIIYYGYF